MVSFNIFNSTKENSKSSQQHSIIELMLTWKKITFPKHSKQKPEDQKRLTTVAGIKGFKHLPLPAEKNQVLLDGKITFCYKIQSYPRILERFVKETKYIRQSYATVFKYP